MLGEQHGEVEFAVEGNIIIATAIGSFNEGGALHYTGGLRKLINDFNNAPFAILVNNLRMEGATPEAFQILEQHNQWLNSQKLVAKAFVVKTSITTGIVKAHSPSLNQQVIADFTEQSAALSWLKEQLEQHQSRQQN